MKNTLLKEAIDNYDNDKMALALEQFLDISKTTDEEEVFLYLSLIFKHGDGVPADEFKAKQNKKRYVEIIKSKADKGEDEYKMKYAAILQYGDGVEIDEKSALTQFIELATNGYVESQFHLYTIYNHGFCGIDKNEYLAHKWLSKATSNEWPEALSTSALNMLSCGDIDNIEKEKAKLLLIRAIDLGDWRAQEIYDSYFN